MFDNGELDDAEVMQRGVLDETKHLLGEDHILATSIMHNLANTLVVMEQYEEAVELEREVVERDKIVLGSHHPDTLSAMTLLVRILDRAGQGDESQRMRNEVLRRRRDPSSTSRTLEHLASSFWYSTAKLDETENLQRIAIFLRQRMLGGEHERTIQARESLVLTLTHRADLAEAIELQEDIVKAREKLPLPNEHEGTHPKKLLAFLFREYGRLEDALTLRRELLEHTKIEKGDENVDTLAAMRELGTALRDHGLLDEAVSMQRTAWKRVQELSEEEEAAIDALENLALSLYSEQKIDTAISYQDDVVRWRREHLRDENRKVLAAEERLAFWLYERGEFEAAVLRFPMRTVIH
jgi:tetratricopeptide (TPR) repeat protein